MAFAGRGRGGGNAKPPGAEASPEADGTSRPALPAAAGEQPGTSAPVGARRRGFSRGDLLDRLLV